MTTSGTFPIYLEIASNEFTGTCGYTYTPADPGRMNPIEQAYPPSDAEWEFYDLILDSGFKLNNLLELSAVLEALDEQFQEWGEAQDAGED